MVVTSRRSLDALQHHFLTNPDAEVSLVQDLLALPLYTVGPATAQVAHELGFTTVLGQDSGNATALAESLISSSSSPPVVSVVDEDSLPLLILAGDRRRPELTSILTNARVDFKEIIVYRTISEPLPVNFFLKQTAKEAEEQEEQEELFDSKEGDSVPTWCVFFSPSGVKAAYASLSLASPIPPVSSLKEREHREKESVVAASVSSEAISVSETTSATEIPKIQDAQELERHRCVKWWSGVKLAALGPTTAHALSQVSLSLSLSLSI